MEKCNQKEPRKWTCDSIGSERENIKSNSEYTGDQVSSSMLTVGRNIMQQCTIKMLGKIF